MPRARVYIAAEGVSAMTNFIAKLIGPAQQVAGFSSLTSSTIRGYQTLGRSFNRNRRF